ncbi:hypothetical protein KBZ00_27080 [Streptomyces sp. RK31]|uniref:hypothetical protein n=1 Tax=Streptomyces sp. RK31 TaxID=2824892 RepID=UPI001B36FD5B|nr:hypothetical protein [Streptomyces sp. RK31]MBQ0974764.1 hypothetical protein [Streptomyces sp. RK31]
MLTSLIPGMRHFRTPFAVGVLVVLQVWAFAGEAIPRPGEASGFMARLYELCEFAGRPVMLPVAGFVLYLIGDVASASADVLNRLYQYFTKGAYCLTPEGQTQLFTFACTAQAPVDLAEIDIALARRTAASIVHEFPDIRMRLIANNLDVYLEHDRLESEAEFRVNVAWSASILWCVLAIVWSPWVLLMLLPTFALGRIGVVALRSANSILVQSLSAGIVESTRFAEFQRRNRDNSNDALTI